MSASENYLHTTHRTVTWFHKAFKREELELAAPFQRNPVWTNKQKSYLIDTILLGLPIPELYMQDVVDEEGRETHIVVDGQQRIRACLDFVEGKFELEGDEINSRWRGMFFESLTPTEKQNLFSYKFVVRVLPKMGDDELRKIFTRLNRNVVALNDQELRNATYWGPFIRTVQKIADDEVFWSESGLFSANETRRMLDHEFISELAIAVLHGPQNKKDRLDEYYLRYEIEFEAQGDILQTFSKTTAEISQLLPSLQSTRWRKKSDFYTLFLEIAARVDKLPFSSDVRGTLSGRLTEFGQRVDALIRLEEVEWKDADPNVLAYARAVARAASDKSQRIERQRALSAFVFVDV